MELGPDEGTDALTIYLQETGRPMWKANTAGRPVCARSPVPAVVSLCCDTSVLYCIRLLTASAGI